jgi:hypothetical protein
MTTVTSHSHVAVPGSPGCYGLLSDDPEIAVVFVHGFLGNPRSTWYDFQGLVDQLQDKYPSWGRCDLFFYSYPSQGQIKPLAEQFRLFLKQLFPEVGGKSLTPQLPQTYSLPSGANLRIPPRIPKQYKLLILVGHSTGALIIRETILQETRYFLGYEQIGKDNSSLKGNFVLDANLRFFAPAHRGAMCSGALGALLNMPLTEWLMGLALRSNSLFMSLQPGSPIVEDIKLETEMYQNQFPNIKALVACSLFGSKDTIVYIGKYMKDPDQPTEPGHTHISICKPTVKYPKPLEFVIDGIARSATDL